MKETVEGRALKIAAQVMQAGGLCRYDTPLKCHRLTVSPSVCDKCIRAWLISKAKKQLKEEREP